MTDTQPAPVEVELFWRPGCPFCSMLRRDLRRSGIPIREINIWRDRTAARIVRAVADGNETVPTVRVGTVALVNPTADAVLRSVRAHAPALLGPLDSTPPGSAGRRRWWARRRLPVGPHQARSRTEPGGER